MTVDISSSHQHRIKDFVYTREVKRSFANCSACDDKIMLILFERYKILNPSSFFSWRKKPLGTWCCAFEIEEPLRKHQHHWEDHDLTLGVAP